jgi:hypothetical protein
VCDATYILAQHQQQQLAQQWQQFVLLLAASAGLGQMQQPQHHASGSTSGTPTDMWLSSATFFKECISSLQSKHDIAVAAGLSFHV